jgi:PAS domain S-box-containing protein
MGEQREQPIEEIKRLRRCINDLVTVLTLPATWSGGEAPKIAQTLVDVLLRMLNLDLVYLRLEDLAGGAPVEMFWFAQRRSQTLALAEMRKVLAQGLGGDSQKWPASVRQQMGDAEISISPFRVGLQREMGVIVAGSQRLDFPGQTERLILSVAANQAAIWLQEARLVREQKQVARELDLSVSQRTSELAATNEELRKKIAECTLTEQKLREQEAELKSSEARKTAILDSAIDCIVTIDHEGRITEFNPAAERTFGYGRDQVIGRHLGEVIVPPALREQHRVGFARYLATGEAHVLGRRMEMAAVRADGSEFPVELAITRIPLDGPPAFTGYLRDITLRQQSEEKLRRSEAYLAEAQKLSHTGSFGWKVSADEHYWSDETFRIFEFDLSTRVTLPMILQRVLPEDCPRVAQVVERASQGGEDWELEYRLLLPQGRVKHVHVVAHVTNHQPGNLEYVGAVMDVTATRCAEEALRRGQADLAHVSRMMTLGELTASIAHEVKQPLGSVMNNAHACLNLLPKDVPHLSELKDALTEIIEGTDRANAVITQVRQLSRKMPYKQTLINLRDVVADILALTRAEANARQVSIHTDLADDLPPALGDRVQLQQVLLNLVVNGMDAMNTIEVAQRFILIGGRSEIRDGKRSCRLSIKDTGVGFKPGEKDRLFEAFYTTKTDGMGMGLAISRSIIENHGGTLWAEANAGPGATFHFCLPPTTGLKHE